MHNERKRGVTTATVALLADGEQTPFGLADPDGDESSAIIIGRGCNRCRQVCFDFALTYHLGLESEDCGVVRPILVGSSATMPNCTTGTRPKAELSRGGNLTSAFLRDRLNDASISREHIRVEALRVSSTQNTSPSVSVTVLGSNPIVLVRTRESSGGKALLSRGQSAVLEAGDGFSFCRGFNGVIHIVAPAAERDVSDIRRKEKQQDSEARSKASDRGNQSDSEGKNVASVVKDSTSGSDDDKSITDGEGVLVTGVADGKDKAPAYDTGVAPKHDVTAMKCSPNSASSVPDSDNEYETAKTSTNIGTSAGGSTIPYTPDSRGEASETERKTSKTTLRPDFGPRQHEEVNEHEKTDTSRNGAQMDTTKADDTALSHRDYDLAEAFTYETPKQKPAGGKGRREGMVSETSAGPSGVDSEIDARNGVGVTVRDVIRNGRESANVINAIDGDIDGDDRGNSNILQEVGFAAQKSEANSDPQMRESKKDAAKCSFTTATNPMHNQRRRVLPSASETSPSKALVSRSSVAPARLGGEVGQSKFQPLRLPADPDRHKALAGVRVALVTFGLSKQRRQVFRDRTKELGGDAHDWPRASTAGSLSSPNSSTNTAPHASDLLSPSSANGAALLLGPEFHTRRASGKRKSKKRSREAPAQSSRPGPPSPPPPARRRLPSSLRSEYGSEEQSEEHSSEISAGTSTPVFKESPDGASQDPKSGMKNEGENTPGDFKFGCAGQRERGGIGGVEELSRLGFTHAVCASEASRRMIWKELGLSSSSTTQKSSSSQTHVSVGHTGIIEAEGETDESTGEGKGKGVKRVEVVSEDWLVQCLREQRRVPAAPYILSPPMDESDGEQNTQDLDRRSAPPFDVKRYACQRPTPSRHHNHQVVDVLDALSDLYDVVGENQRGLSYQRAASILRSLPRKLRASKEIRHVPGIGKRIAENIDEILDTGKLERLDKLRQNEMHVICQALCKVHGVGPKTAVSWYKLGVRSVEDAKQRIKDGNTTLRPRSGEAVMGLTHFDDLQVPMNRTEVVEIAEYVRKQAEELGKERDPDGTVFFEVCGGFRRGKEASHDVDCLVSFQKGNGETGHQGFVEDLQERLVRQGKLVATLFQGKMGGYGRDKDTSHTPSLDREEVLMGIWQLLDRKCRVDIVQVASPQWAFAVLGWSGNRFFEREIRQYAKDELGLRLSQNGLSPQYSDTPLPDVFRTEEDIFCRLRLDYIPPHLRWV